MKHLLMAVVTVVLFTGCYTNSRDAGRPGDETYTEGTNDQHDGYPDGPNDRRMQRSHLNLREGWNH